jgi:hypothetical protein
MMTPEAGGAASPKVSGIGVTTATSVLIPRSFDPARNARVTAL